MVDDDGNVEGIDPFDASCGWSDCHCLKQHDFTKQAFQITLVALKEPANGKRQEPANGKRQVGKSSFFEDVPNCSC